MSEGLPPTQYQDKQEKLGQPTNVLSSEETNKWLNEKKASDGVGVSIGPDGQITVTVPTTETTTTENPYSNPANIITPEQRAALNSQIEQERIAELRKQMNQSSRTQVTAVNGVPLPRYTDPNTGAELGWEKPGSPVENPDDTYSVGSDGGNQMRQDADGNWYTLGEKKPPTIVGGKTEDASSRVIHSGSVQEGNAKILNSQQVTTDTGEYRVSTSEGTVVTTTSIDSSTPFTPTEEAQK